MVDEILVQQWLIVNSKYFDSTTIPIIAEKLKTISKEKFLAIQSLELIDPTMILIVSVVCGVLGIDRFMLGDTKMGVLKLLTMGLFGILAIYDWFHVSKLAKQKNFTNLSLLL